MNGELSLVDFLKAFTIYRGLATKDGSADGSTLVCSALIGSATIVPGNSVYLSVSGLACSADVASFDKTTGTIFFSSALGVRVTVGTYFIVADINGIMQIIKNSLSSSGGSSTNIEVLLRSMMNVGNPVTYNPATDSLEALSNSISTVLGLIASFMADIGDASGSVLGSIYGILGNPGTSVAAQLAALALDVDPLAAGRYQPAETTINLNQGAGTYDLLTCASATTELVDFTIEMPNIVAGGALTSITVQTNHTTPQVMINDVLGAVAHLTARAQLFWIGRIRMAVGDKVRLTINGGATGVSYACQVAAGYRAVNDGGYLT